VLVGFSHIWTASGTHIDPPGYRWIEGVGIGGGSGGGRGSGALGGPGGNAFPIMAMAVPGQTRSVVVGAGGAMRTTDGSSNAGTASSFGSFAYSSYQGMAPIPNLTGAPGVWFGGKVNGGGGSASYYGGGGGGDASPTVGGQSFVAGNGGDGSASGNGGNGAVPGGGGGATQTGAQSGAGARGEIRLRGLPA
jgi:hypothetical protein